MGTLIPTEGEQKGERPPSEQQQRNINTERAGREGASSSVAAFSVETVPLIEEQEPHRASRGSRLKRRGARSLPGRRARVEFSDSVLDLKTGEHEPLRTSKDSLSSKENMESVWTYSAPVGHRLLESLSHGGKGMSLKANRMLVLVLTFLCYMSYHASRKPPSIVKSVLHGDEKNGLQGIDDFDAHGGRRLLDVVGEAFLDEQENRHHNETAGWAPFNNHKTGKALLGDLDLAFLGSYAIGMFVSGHLGDRLDLRKFLTSGMIGSGVCVGLFGAAYFFNIHSMSYFLAIQIIGGLLQATGWPSVVTVMANWFGKGKRGLIMGIWNAHTSIGNILGSLMAASMLQFGWGWSFILPGALIAFIGLLIFFFLVVEPQDIGFLPQSGSTLGSFVRSCFVVPSMM